MTLSKRVKNILSEQAEELEINPSFFYTQNIPQSVISTDKTMILISEISSLFTDRGSDVSTKKENRVEIQIFYRGNTNPDKTELIINQQLEKYHFYQYDSYPDTDPDTGFLTRTMKYENTEVI